MIESRSVIARDRGFSIRGVASASSPGGSGSSITVEDLIVAGLSGAEADALRILTRDAAEDSEPSYFAQVNETSWNMR